MNKNPLFSIITVSFNVEDTIEKTIDSVSKQTFKDYEYLVIDGKSTDKTVEIIKNNEEKVTKWISEEDKGIYNAMNKGAKMAQGKYLFFLNSGDYFYDEEVLEKVSKEIENEDMVYGTLEVYFKGKKERFVRNVTLSEENIKRGKKVSQQVVFVKKEVFDELGGLEEKYKIAADYDLLCKLFKERKNIKKIDVIISEYEGGEGVSANLKKSYSDSALVIKKHYGLISFLSYKIGSSIKLLGDIVLTKLGLKEKFLANAELQKILNSINWLVIENVARNLINFFVFAWVARFLGPDQFGVMTYAIAFVTLFSSLSTLGMDGLLVRDFVSKEERKEVAIGSSFFLKFIGALLLIVISSTYLAISRPEDLQLRLFVLIIGLGYLFRSFDVIDYWFQSRVKSQFSVYARLVAFIISASLKVAFILLQLPLIYFVALYTLELVIVASVLIFFYFKSEKKYFSKWRIDFSFIKELLGDSWPLILGGVASLIYMKIDQIIISDMLGDAELGIYYSAVKLSEMWYFIPTVVGASVFPAILNAKKKGKKLYHGRLQFLFDISTWVSIGIGFSMAVLAPFIINLLYGDKYINAIPVMRVHIWSTVFVFLGVIASKWVIAENRTKNALVRTVIGAIMNIALNYLLIARFGVMGAAVSTLITYAFVNFISLAFSKNTRECFYLQIKSFNLFRILNVKLIFKKIYVGALALFYEIRNVLVYKFGVNKEERETPIIVSLTTYTARFNIVHLTLESLVRQSMKPDKIILWLSLDEITPEKLPKKIKRLEKKGVTVRYVEGNIKSFKKLIYTHQEYPESIMITTDDDTMYPKSFIKGLYECYKENPKSISAYRCSWVEKISEKELTPYVDWKQSEVRGPSFNLFPTGVGGVLYPPGSLNEEIQNSEAYLSLCPKADDVWFKAMGLLNDTKTVMVNDESMDFPSLKKSQKSALWRTNVAENENDVQLKAVFDEYNLYEKLK